jgi:hypothetical protein
MKLELDSRDPLRFKYRKLRKRVLDKCETTDALALLDSEGARMVPGVSPYSIPAGVPPQQMSVVVNLPAIPNEGTLAPAQATEEIPFAKLENTTHTKKYNMM